MVDYLLPFYRRFPGETLVRDTITAYARAITSDKTTTTKTTNEAGTDKNPSEITIQETVTDRRRSNSLRDAQTPPSPLAISLQHLHWVDCFHSERQHGLAAKNERARSASDLPDSRAIRGRDDPARSCIHGILASSRHSSVMETRLSSSRRRCLVSLYPPHPPISLWEGAAKFFGMVQLLFGYHYGQVTKTRRWWHRRPSV